MDSQSSWERQKETKEMTKENGSPIRSGMTEKSTDMIVELSFPNVSIGNPEHSKGVDLHFHGDDERSGFRIK